MITQPYVNFIQPDAGGNVKPVSKGKIYVGKEGLDQKLGGVPIYYLDNQGVEKEITSPIYLNMTGVAVAGINNSTIINPYTKEPISILIENQNGDPVYSELFGVVQLVSKEGVNTGYIRNFDSISDMKSKVDLSAGQKCSTGGTTWFITNSQTPVAVASNLYAKAITAVKLSDWGDNLTLADVQEAQDSSAYSRMHLDVSDIKEISWEGILKIDDWLEWHGAGRFENTIKPSKILRSEIGGDAIIAKRDTSKNLEHFLMQDLGIDLGFSGVFPTLDQLVSMVRITANGSHDTDITYLRCHFANPAHECTVHNVHTTDVGVSSGGTIEGIRMLFCSGDVNDLATASRSSNMFKTIHGAIDIPGSYGEYPISDVVSFGNKCRGMRTLADFKRGTTDFSHNKSYVEDMTDVASISVDGVLKGTIGPDNSGKQTPAAANTKNFYEIQGVDLEVLGGDWDCDNQAGAVAGVLVTDYAFPAETTVDYNSNPSVNVNIRAFTGRNIPFHAVRLINTTDCDVRGINAYDCQLDAVSFEYVAGKIDKQGSPVVSKNNSVDEINSNNCRFQVSATTGAGVKIGEKIANENGLYEIQLVGIPVQPYRATFEPIELNANPRGEDYGTGTPVRWSGSASATVEENDAPYDSSIYLSIEDANNAAIQTFGPVQKFAFTKGEPIYFSVVCRLGTSPRCSIVIQEYNASGSYLTAGYVPLGATSDFELRKRKYVVQNENTEYVKILLAPAAASGSDSSLVGTADFADFKISRKIN